MKTPTKLKIQQRGNKNVPIEESNSKKRKMVFEFDVNSDSSETTDLLVKLLQLISIYCLHDYISILFLDVCVYYMCIVSITAILKRRKNLL